MNYLSIDIGTTGCKCQLFSEKGEILKYLLSEYDFKEENGFNYVNIDAIEAHLRNMLSCISAEFEVSSVCISSMGESFVLLDKDDNILFYPMLYTDQRGEREAEEIKASIGEEQAFRITGVIPHSMYSLSKLLYIKNNAPDLFEKADKVMLIGDYFGYLLTGERVIDYGLASRTGAFDIEKMEFSEEILSHFGIDKGLFSTPKPTGSIVGRIKKEWGIDGNLVLGSHDQICAALGAGVLREGDSVDGMGTVECITTLFKNRSDNVKMGKEGYPCVPYPINGLYCTYILNYSCCSAVNWLRKNIMHGYKGNEENYFAYIEKEVTCRPTDILTLPYFSGAATPYQSLDAKAAIINLTAKTRDYELFQSLMEGTAFEMRLNAETVKNYGITVKNTVATGGGANSEKWLQIKANIQNIPIKTLRSSEGGLCGCAMLQAAALRGAKDLYEARDLFVRFDKKFLPDTKLHEVYESSYAKYKKIYNTLKEIN